MSCQRQAGDTGRSIVRDSRPFTLAIPAPGGCQDMSGRGAYGRRREASERPGETTTQSPIAQSLGEQGIGLCLSVVLGRVCQVVEKSERVIIPILTARYLRRPLHGPHLLPAVHLPELYLAGSQQAEEQ